VIAQQQNGELYAICALSEVMLLDSGALGGSLPNCYQSTFNSRSVIVSRSASPEISWTFARQATHDKMNTWIGWIRGHETLLWWAATISVLMFFLSLIFIPLAVARIPDDYFTHTRRPHSKWADQHFVIRSILFVGKNAAGMLLIIVGIPMLILPGQGLLSIVVGIMLLDFPGKFRLERWVVSRRPVLHSINWLRHKAHREPLAVAE
jgi:hypothetical protein